jgi:hypothetical protein
MDFILAFGLIIIDMLLGIGLALTIRQNKDLTDVCHGYEKEINDCQTKIKGLMIRDNAQDMVTKKLSNDYSKIVKNSDDLKYWAYSNVETWKSQTHFRTHVGVGYAIDTPEQFSIEKMIEDDMRDRSVEEYEKSQHAAESDPNKLDPIVAEALLKDAKHAKAEPESATSNE